VVLSNLEVLNASMIDNNIIQREKLNDIASRELKALSNNKNKLNNKYNDKLK